jgi:hypothetical protein
VYDIYAFNISRFTKGKACPNLLLFIRAAKGKINKRRVIIKKKNAP